MNKNKLVNILANKKSILAIVGGIVIISSALLLSNTLTNKTPNNTEISVREYVNSEFHHYKKEYRERYIKYLENENNFNKNMDVANKYLDKDFVSNEKNTKKVIEGIEKCDEALLYIHNNTKDAIENNETLFATLDFSMPKAAKDIQEQMLKNNKDKFFNAVKLKDEALKISNKIRKSSDTMTNGSLLLEINKRLSTQEKYEKECAELNETYLSFITNRGEKDTE